MTPLTVRRDAILAEMARLDGIVVAFSGGVDSSLVAALAQEALGARARAVTAVSETLAARELEDAKRVARELGIRHDLVDVSELDDPRFVANTSARCFFCQSMRFDELRALADAVGCDVLASGTNADDTTQDRPGLAAMAARRVYQPLLDHALTKADVRELARTLGLSVWDKPAKACLSSRIPHGLEVTQERLRRIERAEDALQDLGLWQLRVRDHAGLARVEIAPDEMTAAHGLLRDIARVVRAAGFDAVSVDIVGYRAGGADE